MGNIEDIVKAIDDELIRIDKEYLLLGNANQLLAYQGLISISEKFNKTLKKALEENKIPHAYQTENTPKQWRIPFSKEGLERRKLFSAKTSNVKNKDTAANDASDIKLRRDQCPYCYSYTNVPDADLDNEFINCQNCKSDFHSKFRRYSKGDFQKNNLPKTNNAICPTCKHNLLIPKAIINEKNIQCLNCGENFRNPFSNKNVNQNTKSLIITKTQKKWIIAIGVVLLLWYIGSMSDNNSGSSSSSQVRNSEWDASVYQVEYYLKNAYLKEPNSYKGIDWSKVNEISGSSEYKYWVRHKYRAKNSFGGYVIENKIFYLDEQGNVVGVKDVY